MLLYLKKPLFALVYFSVFSFHSFSMEEQLNCFDSSNKYISVLSENLKELEVLEESAKSGSIKDQQKYLKILHRKYELNEVEDEYYREKFSAMESYGNNLRKYYEEKLEEFKTDSDKLIYTDYIIYKLAKIHFYQFMQNPENYHERRQLAELIKKLTDKGYGKAYLLRYKAGGEKNKNYLNKSEEFKNNKFIKFDFE